MLHLFNRLKKVLLISTIFILTGCTAKYEITINDTKNIDESLNIIENNKESFEVKNDKLQGATPKEYLETNLNWPTPIFVDSEVNPLEPIKIDGVNYYEQKDISNDNSIGINYNYIFKIKEYNKSNIISSCYDFKTEKINNIFTFKTTSNFKCFEKYKILDKVQFKLNTICKPININSDKKRENTYIWEITKENPSKKINFSLDCTPKRYTINTEKYLGIIMIGIYLLLVIIGILVLKISFRSRNKF